MTTPAMLLVVITNFACSEQTECIPAEPSIVLEELWVVPDGCETRYPISGLPTPIPGGGWLVEDLSGNCQGDSVTRLVRIDRDGSVAWHEDTPLLVLNEDPLTKLLMRFLLTGMNNGFVVGHFLPDEQTGGDTPLGFEIEARRYDNSPLWTLSAQDLDSAFANQALIVDSDDTLWLLTIKSNGDDTFENKLLAVAADGTVTSRHIIPSNGTPATHTVRSMQEPSFVADRDGFLILFSEGETSGDTITHTIKAYRVERDGTTRAPVEAMTFSWGADLEPPRLMEQYFAFETGILVTGLALHGFNDSRTTVSAMAFVNIDGSLKWTQPTAFRNNWTIDSLGHMNDDGSIGILAQSPDQYITISADGKTITAVDALSEIRPSSDDGYVTVMDWMHTDDGVLVLATVHEGAAISNKLVMALYEPGMTGLRGIWSYDDRQYFGAQFVPEADGLTVFGDSIITGTFLHFDSICM